MHEEIAIDRRPLEEFFLRTDLLFKTVSVSPGEVQSYHLA